MVSKYNCALDSDAFFALCYVNDWRDCKNLTSGNFFHDNLADSLRVQTGGQCIASFYGGLANVPTNQLFLPTEGSTYDDDPDMQ